MDESREVYAAWKRRVASAKANIPSGAPTNPPFNDIHLHPPVAEMLQCAKEVAQKSGRHINFSEFCILATEIKKSQDRGHSRQLGRLNIRNGQERRRPRKMSKCSVTHDVFLGGSCNPTTWRHDVAIPLLESLGISYYNPQVAEWSSELIELEHRAKESARILFYVLDRRTRNVVGIVEAANFAGSKRNLVLVLDPYQRDQSVAGETITQFEYEELTSALATLKDLVERQGIPVFHNIPVAINCTAKVLYDKQYEVKHSPSLSEKLGHVQVGGKQFSLKEAFESLDTNSSGEISLADFCLAYRLLTNKKLSLDDLSGIIDDKKGSSEGHNIMISFDQFVAMVNKLRNQNGSAESEQCSSNSSSLTLFSRMCCVAKSQLMQPILTFIEWATNWNGLSSYTNGSTSYFNTDVYIGGSGFDSSWKLNIATPILNESGLKYKYAEWKERESSRAGPSEADVIDHSKVLLFVITNRTRGLETMALASYCIGAGRNVVLCIQQLQEDSTVFGEKLSPLALNDYNRGRLYLADEARRKGVSVFSTVQEAVECAIEQAKELR